MEKREGNGKDKKVQQGKLDNPDMLDTEKESLFDMHDDMKTVDPLPMEELNDQVKDEDDHEATKSTSGSERRYK
ncbi:hypothetical protein [Lysinibacillus odysseyi]|uniref:Uncharacterized protein n=1 Tax=Lysinibacillus odysseyi 34hs-1 = NBRC 100172 TaxID=1220589 RepID=A0A0A3IGK4_9BACI|nr:hypothetical protein [Lysinibacillus odysseyi]KGR83844.1 hypothetical protein CD32_14180 [Lysinibacillus odysseyi 34hs-1 = NBRC 100172]